jgi:hypothetical protein
VKSFDSQADVCSHLKFLFDFLSSSSPVHSISVVSDDDNDNLGDNEESDDDVAVGGIVRQ